MAGTIAGRNEIGYLLVKRDQPDRITLLHPAHNSFWWLFTESPIFVVIVGVVFHVFVARPLLEDMKDNDAAA